MAKSIRDIPKKQRGRPSTGGRREGVMVRLEPAQFEALDGWIKKHDVESRPEAIRRLVELGLKAKKCKSIESSAARSSMIILAEPIHRLKRSMIDYGWRSTISSVET
jgi:metal-responsive CopG/Arc/MetJ family transcriptional regulator